MRERNAIRGETHSPGREEIARYEARILAYDLARDSRTAPGYVPPPGSGPGDASTAPIASPCSSTCAPHRAPAPCAADRRPHRPDPCGDLVVSFWGAVAGPSNVSFGVRAVEWLRDNGAAGLVSDIESIYYSLKAPSTGGPRTQATAGVGTRAPHAGREPTRHRRSNPVITPALPGEGQWRGTGPSVGGARPYWSRPSAGPELPADGRRRRVDRSRPRTQVALYPGRYEPPNDGNQQARGAAPVALEPAGHVQQRFQARGRGWRIRSLRSHSTRR